MRLLRSAEARFLARQAAEQLLAFQMQQSEAELAQSDARYLVSIGAKLLSYRLPHTLCCMRAWRRHAAGLVCFVLLRFCMLLAQAS